ncbi:hypothetical protein BJ912DRAFT_1007016 [Pholiota molesta]|nr:hypothetical protein BJ912DRAFT_1007016 [Pholiota molesta]
MSVIEKTKSLSPPPVSPTEPRTPPTGSIILPTSPGSNCLAYITFNGPEISDELLERCAELFGNHYGVWGPRPESVKGPKIGSRVKMSGKRLRQQCVASPRNTVLATCFRHSADMYHGGDWTKMELVGHAFATVWDYDNGRVGWVTQLVVDLTERKKYIATQLLQMLKDVPFFRGINAIGLVSSHPAACHAICKYSSTTIYGIDLEFCRVNARDILRHSPVAYVKEMELRGTLFEDKPLEGTVSTVFTNFFVDHREPLAALASYKVKGKWVLGDLLDGHEFIIILPVAGSTTPPDVFL